MRTIGTEGHGYTPLATVPYNDRIAIVGVQRWQMSG
jgi:hypothetical protein